MSIQSKLDFDPSTQSFIGRPTCPLNPKTIERKKKADPNFDETKTMATHAMNFMLCGHGKRLKQIVAWLLTYSSFDPAFVADIMYKIVKMSHEISGATVSSITMDMSGQNLKLQEAFSISVAGKIGDTPKIKNTTTINGIKVGVVADPAHLQKSAKSLWHSHQKVELPKKTLDKWGLKYKYAEWKWIVKLIEFDEKYEKSIAPHLKRWVLSTSSYDKMDCKPALAIFNVKTAQALEYMVKHEGWGEEALTAALYVRLWARWFQIIGAYTPLHGFNKKFPIDRKEKEDFILFFMDFYANCKYAENHKSLWQNQKYVLCSSATCLWVADQMLSQPDFEIFLPGYLLGNSVENLHTSVRNVNPLPTPLLYKRILKGIALSQMFSENVKKSNYQLDPGEGWMVNLKDFKKIKAKKLIPKIKNHTNQKSVLIRNPY